jgi:hypothetical protein
MLNKWIKAKILKKVYKLIFGKIGGIKKKGKIKSYFKRSLKMIQKL